VQQEPAAMAAMEAGETSVLATGDGPGGAGDGAGGGATDGGEHRGVAILLGAAAIVAAITGALATGLSSDASDAWQSALRTEVKRSAAALEDVRYLYQVELPPVITVLGARAQRDTLKAAAAASSGYTAQALTIASGAQANLASAIEPSYTLSTDPAYALPGGGVNLARRLADLRAQNPDLVALDPDAIERSGDALATKARLMSLALVPLGLTALLGTLAQAFLRRRGLLLAAGSITLGIGAVAALAVEVLA